MSLEYPNEVRRYLTSLGFNTKKPYGINARGILYVGLSVYLCSQTLNSIYRNWDDMRVRFQSIEHFVITLMYTLILFEYVFMPGRVHGLLDLVEDGFFEYKRVYNDVEKLTKTNIVDDINDSVRIVHRLILMEVLTMIFTPLMNILYKVIAILYRHESLKSLDIKTFPLVLAYGYECETVIGYGLVYIIQVIYLYGGSTLAYCFTNSCTFAMRRVTADTMLFTITLNYFDGIFSDRGSLSTKELGTDENDLKMAFGQVVNHHSLIYRKCKSLNEGLGMTITVVNYTVTFLICLFIYSFVKVNTSILKLKYAVQMIPCVLILYIYSLKGQELKNENDNMYQAIVDFSWLEKPKWFKKCFLIMLTRAKTRTEVAPFGMYVVDLNNFSMVMNAGYSYYNIFNRFQ